MINYTYIKFMTDGILLAETQGDRFLDAYDTIIIDEAHERSLNIDFLLGYLKKLLPKRPDFKVIITSATIDTQRFSKHFNNVPVIEVSGRTYPVEVRYHSRDDDMIQAIIEAVDEVTLHDRLADMLIFLAGEREIREAAETSLTVPRIKAVIDIGLVRFHVQVLINVKGDVGELYLVCVFVCILGKIMIYALNLLILKFSELH